MLKTYEIYDQLSVATDFERLVIIEQNAFSLKWEVFIPSTDDYIAKDLDTFEEAEGTAFQWLSQVEA